MQFLDKNAILQRLFSEIQQCRNRRRGKPNFLLTFIIPFTKLHLRTEIEKLYISLTNFSNTSYPANSLNAFQDSDCLTEYSTTSEPGGRLCCRGQTFCNQRGHTNPQVPHGSNRRESQASRKNKLKEKSN